jgi:hypothetical protein
MHARPARLNVILFVTPLLAALLCSCSFLTQFLPSEKEAQQRALDIRNLQLSVMRFADEYAGRVGEAIALYQQRTQDGQERLKAQNWRVQQTQSAYEIASGSNAVTNALDMVVLASLSRMVIEDLWAREKDPDQIADLRQAHVTLEQRSWELVGQTLNDEQKAQLRKLIADWREHNPRVYSVAYVHFEEFAAAVSTLGASTGASAGNLLSLVGLDVFRSLDPAVREITQTRELAERSIFYLQRTPTLLDLQIERLAYELAVQPEAQALLADLGRASLVGSASDRLVDSLPDLVARERNALVSQVMSELDKSGESFSTASRELRGTLEAGTETAEALQGALATLDRLMNKFQATRPASAKAKSEPMNVRDYVELLREANAAAQQFDALAQSIDHALPQTGVAMEQAAGSMRGLLDRAFWQVLILILVALVGAVLAGLAYRALSIRLNLKRAAN